MLKGPFPKGGIVFGVWIATVVVAPGASPPWEPPKLWVETGVPEATGTRDLVPHLALGSYRVVLEETLLGDVGSRFSATIGSAGDASESLAWVCLEGRDEQGPWALWVESGEIHGPMVGGFLLLRQNPGDQLDRRCVRVEGASISLPPPLRLGMSRTQVIAALGTPTSNLARGLIYYHHRLVMQTPNGKATPEQFDVSNTLYVRLRGEVVDGFQVWRTTSS